MATLTIVVDGSEYEIGEVASVEEGFSIAKSMSKGGSPIEINGRTLIPAVAVARSVFKVTEYFMIYK